MPSLPASRSSILGRRGRVDRVRLLAEGDADLCGDAADHHRRRDGGHRRRHRVEAGAAELIRTNVGDAGRELEGDRGFVGQRGRPVVTARIGRRASQRTAERSANGRRQVGIAGAVVELDRAGAEQRDGDVDRTAVGLVGRGPANRHAARDRGVVEQVIARADRGEIVVQRGDAAVGQEVGRVVVAVAREWERAELQEAVGRDKHLRVSRVIEREAERQVESPEVVVLRGSSERRRGMALRRRHS